MTDRRRGSVMEWQPIETAPDNVHVELGFWEIYNGQRYWRTCTGIAWRSTCWGGRRRCKWEERATHWRHTPPPPADTPPGAA
jgi:hypothetical protein